MIKGTDIRVARNRAGMSQEALAAAIGVTLRTIGNWERSATAPRDKEPILREILGDHLDGAAAASPRLRSATDVELLAEIARRFARSLEEEGTGDVASAAEKSNVVEGVFPAASENGNGFGGPDPEAYPEPLAADAPGEPSTGQRLRDEQDKSAEDE